MINPFKSKKGLGRGLSSLIGDSHVKTSKEKISAPNPSIHLYFIFLSGL